MKKKHWQWLGEDHITYVVQDIQSWRAVYVNIWGFKETHHTVDACPKGSSSMELYGLQAGRSRVALVSPINRASISHVQTFLDVHGDHSVQHVAIGIRNLEAFVEEMREKGFKFLGEIKRRTDQFGHIKQIFAKRFDRRFTPGQGPFSEFVERPKKTKTGLTDFFSSAVAGELYEDVENDVQRDIGDPFIDFSLFS